MPHRAAAVHVACVAATVATIGVIAACGGKPAYCSDVSDLKQSVQDFKVRGAGAGGVKSQVDTIRGQAESAISAAKSDFPEETSALRSSVTGLTTAVQQLPSSASAADYAKLLPVAASVKNAVTGFTDATDSKC